MDDEKNDYDRMAERIEKTISIVWNCQQTLEQEENHFGKALCSPALRTAVRELNQISAQARGLAEAQRAYQDETN